MQGMVRVYCSSRKNASRQCRVIFSITESPPARCETDRIVAADLSPEKCKIVSEKAIVMNNPGYGQTKGRPQEFEDLESLSDFAFMMEMDDAKVFISTYYC